MDKPSPLVIPYLEQLDASNITDATSILHEHGNRVSVDSVNWKSQFPYHPLTAVYTGHNGSYIFIEFFVRCNFLRAVNTNNNSPVSQDSCVEFFVSPTGDNFYFNFELNCIGAINASCRSERHNPTRLNDEQLARIIRYASCGTRPFNEVEGLFSWSITMAIPLDLIGLEFKGEPIQIKANFNKCASATSQPHYLSWWPIDTPSPDFHQPSFFGPVTLAGK
ncbi:MAG: hypothetical protein K2J42_04390 [Muribaculaceae bacterium]|nr:hypothetical protein [Muribaculaceae bacterium]